MNSPLSPTNRSFKYGARPVDHVKGLMYASISRIYTKRRDGRNHQKMTPSKSSEIHRIGGRILSHALTSNHRSIQLIYL